MFYILAARGRMLPLFQKEKTLSKRLLKEVTHIQHDNSDIPIWWRHQTHHLVPLPSRATQYIQHRTPRLASMHAIQQSARTSPATQSRMEDVGTVCSGMVVLQDNSMISMYICIWSMECTLKSPLHIFHWRLRLSPCTLSRNQNVQPKM